MATATALIPPPPTTPIRALTNPITPIALTTPTATRPPRRTTDGPAPTRTHAHAPGGGGGAEGEPSGGPGAGVGGVGRGGGGGGGRGSGVLWRAKGEEGNPREHSTGVVPSANHVAAWLWDIGEGFDKLRKNWIRIDGGKAIRQSLSHLGLGGPQSARKECEATHRDSCLNPVSRCGGGAQTTGRATGRIGI